MGLKIHSKAKQGHIVRIPSKRQKLLRKIRTFTIVFVILTGLVVGGAFLYAWYSGQQVDEAAFAPKPVVKPKPTAVPGARDPNAPIGASIQLLSTPVIPGSNASLALRTSPDAVCTIQVLYNNVAVKDSGLVPKKADVYGVTSWSWTVAPDTPLGTWPVKIVCELNKKTAYVQGELEVKKTLE
jgi:hypothetical protein